MGMPSVGRSRCERGMAPSRLPPPADNAPSYHHHAGLAALCITGVIPFYYDPLANYHALPCESVLKMTITKIINYHDLMYRATKDQATSNGSQAACSNSQHVNSGTSVQPQLPSIVISDLPRTARQASLAAVVACHQAEAHSGPAPVTGKVSTPTLPCNAHSMESPREHRLQAQLSGSDPSHICHVSDHQWEESPKKEMCGHETKCSVMRPTTLSAMQSSLSAPKPPEFSISPADSLSKASSNEQVSSNAFLPPGGKFMAPHSPSSLSVNFCYNNGNMVLSPSFTSLQGSLASSINDLTVELEQLEKAIRHNDVKFVTRMLEMYMSKSQSDKVSQCSKRSGLSQETRGERPLLRSQTAFDEQLNAEGLRRESGSTEDRDYLALFTSSLHLAIENNAYDVTLLLLQHGVDPNEAGVVPLSTDFWRRSSHTSEESAVLNQDRLHLGNLSMVPSTSREPLIRTPSIRTAMTPILLSPQAGVSFVASSSAIPLPQLYFSLNSSPSSVNSDLSSMCPSATKFVRLRAEMLPGLRTVYQRPDGTSVDYSEEYTRDKLFVLPPIYLAVALNNSVILRELIKYGANVNVTDSHGVTPLHICLCQEHISRACLHLLIQSGAKLRVKNKQMVAPYELVEHELTEEVTQIQRTIIEESFGQLLPSKPKTKRKDSTANPRRKSLVQENSSSSINLSVPAGKHYVAKEESVDSCSSGPTLSRLFESKERKKSEQPKLSKLVGREVQICFDDPPGSETPSGNPELMGIRGPRKSTAEPSSNLFSATLSGIMGHKRSFACDSSGAPIANTGGKSVNNSLSQSTQHLSSGKSALVQQAATSASGAPPPASSHHSSFAVGARIFGRRRSGDDNVKNQSKGTAKVSLSRANTQDEAKVEESLQQQSMENSLTILCQMSSNMECIHLIIANLQKHLPEIILLHDSQNTLFTLHSGLSRLFCKSYQAILDNFSSARDQLMAASMQRKQEASNKDSDRHLSELEEQVQLICLKQEMALQLCGLLRCALHCLKGGQTFQYTSLQITNNECSEYGASSGNTKTTLNDKASEKYSAAISAAANIGKHFRNLRLNDSFNFKQKEERQKTSSKEDPSSPQRRAFDKSRLVAWMRQMHLSPRLSQHRQLHMINELILNSAGMKGWSDERSRPTDKVTPAVETEAKNFISILIQEGLDLILNVLNNAITLHKRVSGSKQSCLPSKRSRNCIYHCLQILSARAILFASQNEEAQQRLLKEGSLKVLVASIDSTHDPQLICLALQIIANLSTNPSHQPRLIDADLADCLMQLILPSDEWFYTNHSTKYAKFVKHHAARVMVYLGLEKRLRNKVYLFDLIEELGLNSPPSESAEDSYIMQTSVAPTAIYSIHSPKVLIGSSVEGIILDLIKQVEDKIINGEDSLCVDPLNEESYLVESGLVEGRVGMREPPAIQVDMPSGLSGIADRRVTNHPNCFFYLSTLPISLQPLILLRMLQHRMFGCISYWAWHSNAVSRASVASAGGSSIEFNRSRASSNASNVNFEISNVFNLKRNVNLHCSNTSLSPGRIEVDRRPSVKGLLDNRLTLQNSLPLASPNLPKGVQMSNSLSTIGQPIMGKLSIQGPGIQRLSLIEYQLHQHLQSIEPHATTESSSFEGSARRFRFSSLRRNRHSLSTENNCSPSSQTVRNNSLDTCERNEAYIMAFQRELQNLPKSESPLPLYGNSSQLTNSLASILRETLECAGTPEKRPRSCSVPRITLESHPYPSTLLQLPCISAGAVEKGSSSTAAPSSINPLSRSATSDVSYCNTHVLNSGPSPNLSPIKVPRNLNESPISYASTFRSTSRSGSRSGSAGQVITETIMPNVHKAILKLLLDWVNMCPRDFKQGQLRRELIDFLNRVSLMGDQYRWLVEEIRLQAGIDEKDNFKDQSLSDNSINKEYKNAVRLILSGELPCSKEEAAILAVIQLRIEETSPQRKENEDHHHHSIGSILPSTSLRQNSIIDEKLRPICEDVKESPVDSDSSLHLAPGNMSSSFDELEEDEQDEIDGKELSTFGPPGHARHGSGGRATAFACHARNGNDLRTATGRNSVVANSSLETSQHSAGNSSFLPALTRRATSRLCHWMSSNWTSQGANFSSIDARECLPPIYHNTKNIAKTIKEQKRKLFHTPIYESEQQLKKLYIQTCKRLPAFGCRIFQVKELLHGKTNRRATRLLGICLERIVLLDCKTLQLAKVQPTTNLQQWRTGGGRSHDRLVLEFRGTKWSFVTPSQGSLRAIGTVLWEIMQDLDACFLDTLIAGERSERRIEEGEKNTPSAAEHGFNKAMHFRDELLRLESLLHFPEEVALCLTKVEYELFYNIEPVYYIRQVTVDLGSERVEASEKRPRSGDKYYTVLDLIERFNEVSSWITHIIISQPTHEMRKAILSCIMRVVQTCWNLGNFNTAVEILAGLKSEKLKPFWLSIEQKDEPFLRKKLSRILLTLEEPSEEYKSAVIRALDIPHSQVIPFFGAFLRDLKNILRNMPSLIVLSNEVNLAEQSVDTQTQTTKIESISDFNGEENYMSRIGVGGIINMEKMYKAHQVLDNIRTFHVHSIRRTQLLNEIHRNVEPELFEVAQMVNAGSSTLYYQVYCNQIIESELCKFDNSKSFSSSDMSGVGSGVANALPTATRSTSKASGTKEEKDECYQIDLDSYRPIQAMPKSHGISIIPLNVNLIDYHQLQAMHHGTTIIHYEEDTGRSSIVYLQLEQSNSTIAWCKPFWSTSLRSSGNAPQDYQLSLDIEEVVLSGNTMKYETKEQAMVSLEEGFIDLMYLKDIVVGQTTSDLALIGRRHALPDYALAESTNCSIRLLFGVNLSDNRTTEFIAPKSIASIWVDGLRSVLRLIQNQKLLCDQRILWLKEKYLQLYYEDSACVGPTPAEAIRVFGGRKWTIDAMGASHQSLQMDLLSAKLANNQAKLRKKKSTVSLAVIRDYSTRSQLSINSEPDGTLGGGARSGQASPQHGGTKSNKSSTRSQAQVRSQSDQTNENTTHDSQSSLSGKSSSSYDNVTKTTRDPHLVLDASPIHTSLLTSHYRDKFCRRTPTSLFDSLGSPKMQSLSPRKPTPSGPSHTSQASPSKLKMAITHSSNMNFIEYSELFRSFLICIRRDIKDIFEQIASKSDIHTFKEAESSYLEEELINKQKKQESTSFEAKSNERDNKFLGLLTRNTIAEQSEEDYHKSRIFDAIATASIVTNSAGIDSLKTSVLTATDFYAFILTYQCEDISLNEVKKLIQMHEPNPVLRRRSCLSFEGFARYLMDKNNFAYTPELSEIAEEDMDYPLSHYYMASSHNTYLTGHQLKGESSVELYSQVLLTGCRCVELDCWDGDDGMPLIYHGHTLTSKIPFKKVVETINEKAFVASPYPVILSVENHCSLQQQAKMAQIFVSIFGDKLVTKFLFDSDYYDEPQLPSPNQLKYRILIKNKKLRAPLHPSTNVKMRINIGANKGSNGRTNSLVSNVSTGSLNEEEDDEYDDEDDDEDVDDSLPSTVIAEEEATKSKFGGLRKSHPDHGTSHESDSLNVLNSPFAHSKVVRKSSSQIAPELSDLVIYCQAIKFRGLLNTTFNLSPTNSTMATPISKKIATRKMLANTTFNSTIQASASLLPVIESNRIKEELREMNMASPTFQQNTSANSSSSINRRPNSSACCYQVSSINENTAKKLCRKSPLAVIAHTESQIMRTYPAGMRIDSSNFNPVIFWAFGIQSVALNYQTVDTALHINSAMFEQNGGCGYVLKTNVMRDKSHMMFGRFNPWEKEFDGLHTINLTITIISGQYVCPNTNTGSPQVEVEIIGIPVDCNRQRTKIVQRNSLNPIWNDTFFFRIKFVDLAFLRVTVTDVGANHLAAQRILPVKCLKQGYRHLRLHNPQNQSLPLSTLFIYSSYEEEGLDVDTDTALDKLKMKNKMVSKIDLNRLDCGKNEMPTSAPVKRRMFFLVVHGVMAEEPSTILKITQESTVTDVITQALNKANKLHETVHDYVLLEEVNRGWEKRRIGDRNAVTQRILDPTERPLEAQNNWKGEGRFILKKLADDPSTRAWMTTIRASSANKDRLKQKEATVSEHQEMIADWEQEAENETFLVCIYNVSEDQPYTILKASVGSSAQDIISQALLKAHRNEDPKLFTIVEEVENFSESNQNDLSSSFNFKNKTGIGYRRVVSDHENIYDVQTQWKNKGKFELKYRKDITASDNTFIKNSSPSTSKLLRGRGSLKKLSQIHRTYSKRLQRRECVDSPSHGAKSPSGQQGSEECSPRHYRAATTGTATGTTNKNRESEESRQVHSEGELPSDSEEKTKEAISSLSRLKKLSLKRLKVWKS